MSHTDGFSVQREIGIVCIRFQKPQIRECMKVKNAFITKVVDDSAGCSRRKNLFHEKLAFFAFLFYY